MLETKRIKLLILTFVFFTFVYETSIIAQDGEPVSAIVIVQTDYLRIEPSNSARTETLVVKGAKLKVIPVRYAKGWYFAYLEKAPSVSGYIHGNSIRITKDRTVSRATKNEIIVAPKNIILDKTPNLIDTEPSVKAKIKEPIKSGKNYCQPPLFCPDIDDVQVILFDNKDKFVKGKFEKTLDWEKRKPSILSTLKLNATKNANETIYFLTDGFYVGGFNAPEYNADKELWTFNLEFKENYSQTCLPIISPNTGQEFCLVVPSKLPQKIKAFVSMPPSVARTNDNKLQIVYVGRIIEPYIWLNDYSPIKNIRSGIYFNLEKIICLNQKTGQSWKVDFSTDILNESSISDDPKNEQSSIDENELIKFRRLLVADPQNADAYFGMGEIYFRQEKYDEAISPLKTALFWNSELIEAHIKLGKIYLLKGECLNAKNFAQSALQINNQNNEAIDLKNRIEKCLDEAFNSIPTPYQKENRDYSTRYNVPGIPSEIPLYTSEKEIKETKPANTSNLTIRAAFGNITFFVLDKSVAKILAESGLSPIVKTKRGKDYDLIETFIRSLNDQSNGKYLAFRANAFIHINKHKVAQTQTNYAGQATVNLPFGNYYIFSAGWYQTAGFFTTKTIKYVWDKEVVITKDDLTTYAGLSEANYVFK